MSNAELQTYWRRSESLTRLTLGLWALFALFIPMLVVPLNSFSIPYIDAPLGFFMMTQGALIAFTIVLWAFARRQDRIDRDHTPAQHEQV